MVTAKVKLTTAETLPEFRNGCGSSAWTNFPTFKIPQKAFS